MDASTNADDVVASRVAEAARVPLDRAKFFLEAAGGDVDVALRMIQGAFLFFSVGGKKEREREMRYETAIGKQQRKKNNPFFCFLSTSTHNETHTHTRTNTTEHEGGGVRARTSPRRGGAATTTTTTTARRGGNPAPLRRTNNNNAPSSSSSSSSFLASLIRLPFEILGVALTAAAAGVDLVARATQGVLPGPLTRALRGVARAAAAIAPSPAPPPAGSRRRGRFGGTAGARIWRGGTATIGPAYSSSSSASGLAGDIEGEDDGDDSFADPLAAASRFAAAFVERYGDGGPAWAVAPWSSAADAAAAAHKLCFVYLHAPRHDATDDFCRSTLCDARVSRRLSSEYVCWGGDVSRSPEAHALAGALGARAFPFAALLVKCSPSDYSSSSSSGLSTSSRTATLAARAEGPVTAAELGRLLDAAAEEHGPALAAAAAAAADRERDRALRREQDAEYEAALRADREKERERERAAELERAREEERKRAEEEAAAKEAAARSKAEAAAAALAARRAEARAALEKRQSENGGGGGVGGVGVGGGGGGGGDAAATSTSTSSSTPATTAAAAAAKATTAEANAAAAAASPSPSSTSATATAAAAAAAAIRVRLRDGTTRTRRFAASDPLELVYTWVDSLEEHASLRYSLVQSYPRLVLGERSPGRDLGTSPGGGGEGGDGDGDEIMGKTLEELKLTPQAALFVQCGDDDDE